MVDLVVKNFGAGVVKDITFAFSEPLEDSTGFILSELPYLKEGMGFLGPGTEGLEGRRVLYGRFGTLPKHAYGTLKS